MDEMDKILRVHDAQYHMLKVTSKLIQKIGNAHSKGRRDCSRPQPALDSSVTHGYSLSNTH